jgi:hypothetical protein
MGLNRATVQLALVAVVWMGCQAKEASKPCLDGQACTPATGADPCHVYLSCSGTAGASSCEPSGDASDGTACGASNVCLAGKCIVGCVPGQACVPSGTTDPCKTYATACSNQFTQATCAIGSNQVDGTPCGTGQVCLVGSCIAACSAGLTCIPVGTANPCKVYATTCDTTLSRQDCASVANQPDGTACDQTSVCGAGACLGSLASPTFSPPGGSYPVSVSVTIAGPDPAATVYYTTDGSAPSDDPRTMSAHFVGRQEVILQTSSTVRAFAALNGRKSPTASEVYQVQAPPSPTVSLGSGFTPGAVQLNGNAVLNGSRLQVVPELPYQAGSAFFPSAVNIQSFTTDFSFQISAADLSSAADGLTFTVQGNNPYAIGSRGGGLGYGLDPKLEGLLLRIDKSVALKFDVHDNVGEGSNSTGLFTNGAPPSTPALDLTPSGILLHSGHIFDVHVVYDGITLQLSITDPSASPAATFRMSQRVDIPSLVGGTTGFVGFTSGTGIDVARHEIIRWTYTNSQ